MTSHSQMQTPTSPPSANVVGNLFVEQYYSILHHKPEEVYKFYKDSSVLSRPDPNGEMTSITTMRDIDEAVRALDYGSYKVIIGTVDAQSSYKEGVIVLVTGCLARKDNSLQKFTQSFFLAPQENGGFFVLNDVFRYVSDSHPIDNNHVTADVTKDAVAGSPIDPAPEPVIDANHKSDPDIFLSAEKSNGNEEVYITTETKDLVVDVVDPSVHTTVRNQDPDVITAESDVQEDAPKKSYASIVKVTKASNMSSAVSVSNTNAKVVKTNTEKQALTSVPAPPPENSVPDSNHSSENSSPPEVEGHSIYIRNLPLNATPSQLEVEFKKFGPIKPEGVQVRNHKQHGYCFGFVEFETLSSMQSAIKASPITIAGRQAVVEEKRTTMRVGSSDGHSASSGRGRFPPSRGGFRNDNFRGRGGFGGSTQGHGRNEFRSRGEFSNRGRGPSGTSGEGYQRATHPNKMNLTGVSA